MNLHAIGLNHKSAPVEIREKLAFSASSIPIALSSLTQSFSSSEAVILSTCNRVEIYGTSPDDSLNKESLLDFFSAFHGLPKENFAEHMYHYQNLNAVKHLFFVTSSLDSLVVGESQILSQVKEAYMTAASHRKQPEAFSTNYFNVSSVLPRTSIHAQTSARGRYQ